MQEIVFNDENLACALKEALGHPFTPDRLAQVERLDWAEYRAEGGLEWEPVADLEGIQYCKQLQVLSMDGNAISSLEPLQDLVQPGLRIKRQGPENS